MPIDHMGFNVTDLPASKAFFVRVLAPLGMVVIAEDERSAMLGASGHPEFWLGSHGPSPGPLHVAFSADNREQVRQFHAAALAAGAKDNGPPGIREKYHPNYYAAYVIGPDGHNIEAVCHRPPA